MKVFFIASECAPIVKVGGLGDVAGALPKALKKNKVDVTVCLPFYKTIDPEKYALELVLKELKVFYEEDYNKVTVWRTMLPGSEVPVLLFENVKYLSGGGVYFARSAFCESHREVERFSFFSKSILEYLKNQKIKADLFHCNDWHTASVPILLATLYKKERILRHAACVFTIHNLGNQGIADLVVLDELGINKNSLKFLDWDAQNRDIDLMMQGIVQSDAVNAVSETYAHEILTKQYGAGLEEVLRGKSGRLFGILNGIDYDVFDPQKDQSLFFRYNLKNWREGKKKNREELKKRLNLSQNDKPLVGMVTRLTEQKGLNLVEKVFDKMIQLGFQFVLLGLGDEDIEEAFKELERKYPQDVSINLKFSTALANQIYAVSDVFLMPSKFEPCGLGQMIALKYGAIPIVRATGGLKDTIQDRKTGFVFKSFTAEALLKVLIRARDAFSQKEAWKKIVEEGMKEDFSWDRSAKEYLNLYQKALQFKHESISAKSDY